MRTSASPEVGRRALARVAAKQHGVFTRAQARAVNCSDSVLHRLVSSGEVERVHPRVYRFTAAPSSLTQRAKAATLYAGERAWVSHRTAAFKLGMIDRSPGTIELISERDLRGGTDLKVRLGRVPRSHTIVRDGIPMTNSIRTMVDLASVLGDERLEFVLDHCLYEDLSKSAGLCNAQSRLAGPVGVEPAYSKTCFVFAGKGLRFLSPCSKDSFSRWCGPEVSMSRTNKSPWNRIPLKFGAWTSSIPSTRSSSRSMVVAGMRDDSKPGAIGTGTT
jgi:hypothetical protein